MPSSAIDFRSDTVTRPTPEMRRIMAEAPVGDDVLGDDPTVNRLQEYIADLMGKPAACFVPSGTMANQLCIAAQTRPGDEIICHELSHIIHHETGAPAALSGVMICPLRGKGGLFEADQVRAAIRPDDSHFPQSRMLVIENTQNEGGGTVWPIEQIERVTAAGRDLNLTLHLDGARIWNACAKTGVSPAQYAKHFDTISCCFSKGLGAPVGSAVVGEKATIARVHRLRKMFGGSMRQSGILAAAALYALEHNRDRIVEDHENAQKLAQGLNDIRGIVIDAHDVPTNMVYFDLEPTMGPAAEVCQRLDEAGVRMLDINPTRIRAVCHLDITTGMIDEALTIIARIASAIQQSRS